MPVVSAYPEPLPDLPKPDPGLLLWRVSMLGLIASLPKRRSEKMLRVIAEMLASEEALAELLPIRPASDHAAMQKARHEALAMYRANLPAFLAAMERG